MRRRGLFIALSAVLAGCGGSGDPDDDLTTIVVTEPFEASVNTGGGASVIQVLVADHADNTSTRALMTFSLATLPAGAQVVSATLHTSVTSSDQGLFAAMGPVVVDHVDSAISFIAARDAAALLSAFVVLDTNGAVGPRDAVVTAAVQGDVAAGRTACRLRLRHRDGDTNGNGIGDFTRYGSQNDPPRATLEIRFR